MARAVTPEAEAMLADLPGWIVEDTNLRAVLDCFAREGQLLQAAAEHARDNAIPGRVDELGAAWHEIQLGLPVNPPGLSLAQRVQRILARYGSRSSHSGSDWQVGVTGLVGGPAWRYEEDSAAFTITITVPWSPGSDRFRALEQQVRRLPTWPCHLDLVVESEEGFVLDESELDQEQFHAS